jgi:penicillin-binding protein 1A
MAGTTRAGRRGTDVDPFGSPARDAPPSGFGGARSPGPGRGPGRAANGQGPLPGGGGGGRPPRAGGPSGERPAKKRSIIWRWRRAFFLLALMGLLAVAAGGAVLAQTELPEPKGFAQATFICAAYLPDGETCNEGTAMAKLQGDDANRANVAYDDLSPNIINAVVAAEDRNFFEHDGVAPLGIARALYRDLKGDAVQQGGSTITQQYVKNAFLSPERALTRKLKEAVLSIKLEQRMSKEEILERYLNTVYFGRWAYGIQAASRVYFGVDATDLDIGQAAYLAGLIRAPEAADATLHPEEAARRRHTTLIAMEEEGYISREEAALYDKVEFVAPYFLPRESASKVQTLVGKEYGVEYVTAYVARLLQQEPFNFSEEEVYSSGLRVYTSLDLDMQGRAWAAVNGVLNQPNDPAAGMVAVDDQGMVRAMVGGRDYKANQTNYAVRGLGSNGRPVGSTFKPIALAEAVATGKSLKSRYDAPGEYEVDQSMYLDEAGNPRCEPKWTVNNYAESEGGNMDLMEATAQSSNTAYAQLMVDLGPEKVLEMAKKLGMPGDFEPLCPTMVLGTENASPLDMAGVYSTFANHGLKKAPSLITRVDRVGDEGQVTTLYDSKPPQGEQVLTTQQADMITHTLEGVITNGTGHAANIGRPAAGKTGTSQANKDAWFVGYVPKLTAAVWMGYPNADWPDPNNDNKLSIPPMNPDGIPVHGGSATGGSFPAKIWHDFMLSVTDARGWNDPFTQVPEDVLESGIRLDEGREPAAPTDTSLPPQPGQPGNGNGNGNGGPRPTRATTTSTAPTTTTSESTTTTAPDTTTTTLTTIPITRPGGGGGPG